MATVLNSKSKHLHFVGDNGEPTILVESEGDKFIKQLSYKQTDTNLTLERHLQQEKDFTPAYSFLPITEYSTGTTSLSEFLTQTKEAETLGENCCNLEESCSENTSRAISRHVRELAMCVKPNSVETKLLKFAISCNKVSPNKLDTRPPEHPINHLSEIHHNLFSYLSRPSAQVAAKTVTRKRKQLLEALSDPIGPKPKFDNTEKSKSSLWDVTEYCTRNKQQNKLHESKVYSCQPQIKRLYTIQDGKIVPMDNNEIGKSKIMVVADVNPDLKDNSRLTLEEIKQMPRFKNYEKGSPSEVLYLKNIANSVSEDDLKNLFEKFENTSRNRLSYRLMKTGRMRGQAFVTFCSVNDAVRALEEFNGIILKGKPIIMQFGNGKQN